MPEYLHPGVYIEEIERGPRPIEGVPTSTAAFLGETERGPIRPRLVTSYRDYQRSFGDIFAPDKFVPYTVNGFFENGGKRVYISRLVGPQAKSSEAVLDGSFSVRAAGPGKWGNRVFVRIDDSTTRDSKGKPVGFRLRLAYWSNSDTFDPFDPFTPEGAKKSPRPDLTEDFDDLVAKESSPDYYGKRLPFIDLDKGGNRLGSDSSALGLLVRNAGAPSDALPANGSHFLSSGDDDTVADPDYTGLTTGTLRPELQGLEALKLDPFREVSLLYAPNATETVAHALIDHCDQLRFRFAVIDCPKNKLNVTELNPRITDSTRAAFYYPWILISDPRTGARKLIPPGGHVLGVYARTDNERGVFKAPANEVLRGVLDLEYDINDNTQDTLNPMGVNVIRSFPGRGIRVWGARTITSDSLWKYVSVRRLFIFLERSIYENTQWVVFEPNDDKLWARLIDSIRLFLRTQWRLGALLGRTEQEAFHITCDRTTMTPDDILNGRLICEIGIAPVRPAEFVIFRIFQDTSEAQK